MAIDLDQSQGRTSVPARSADPRAAAIALRPLIQDRADEAERLCNVTDEVQAALLDSGLLSLMTPAELGGAEADTRTLIDVIAELSYADGATGWSAMANMVATAMAGAYLSDDAVDEIFRSENLLCAGMRMPIGRAVPEAGGYRVTGKFGFGSGMHHAGWILGGFRATEADGKAIPGPGGGPMVVGAFVPATRVKTLGNWDVLGLRATGSFDYLVEEQVVEAGFVMAAQARRGGQLYRMGEVALPTLCHASFPLGVAARVLDELRTLAESRIRPPFGVLSGHRTFQHDFGEMSAQVRAARAFVRDSWGRLYDAAGTDAGVPDDLKAECRLSANHSVMTAVHVTHRAYLLAGSEGLRNGSLIQRCFRDAQAAAAHVLTSDSVYTQAGQALAGGPAVGEAQRDLLAAPFVAVV
jgi:indole-3-acetate monooxygenase